MFRNSAREMAIRAEQKIDDHVKECIQRYELLNKSIESTNDLLKKLLWGILAACAAVAYDLLKSKGIF